MPMHAPWNMLMCSVVHERRPFRVRTWQLTEQTARYGGVLLLHPLAHMASWHLPDEKKQAFSVASIFRSDCSRCLSLAHVQKMCVVPNHITSLPLITFHATTHIVHRHQVNGALASERCNPTQSRRKPFFIYIYKIHANVKLNTVQTKNNDLLLANLTHLSARSRA